MFCTKCGKQIPEGTRFCPACGTPAETRPSGNIFVRLWNNPTFGWAAVKLNRAMNIVLLLFGVFLLLMGAWLYGLLAIVIGVFCIYEVRKKKHDRTHTVCPNCGAEIKIGKRFCDQCGTAIPVQTVAPELLEEAGAESSVSFNGDSLNGKKVGLIAFVILMPLLIWAAFSSGLAEAVADPVIYNMKNAVWDEFGPQPLGEVIDDNFRGAEWTYEMLDDTSAIVYVTGYMPLYAEDVRLTFYYEEQPDGETFSFQVNSVDLLDSMEGYTDFWNIALFMELMYGESNSASSAAAA